MGKTLYIDPIGGLAGDMLCAALLDAGLEEDEWRRGLDQLAWSEKANITIQKTMRGVFSATHLNISPPVEDNPVVLGQHHHAPHTHGHHHGHHHSHTHTHGQPHGHNTAGPLAAQNGPAAVPWSDHHRGFTDIKQLIDASPLPDIVKSNAIAVFQVLGEAEAAIHGSSLEEIHFHEVGAVDSILDIVGFCYGLYLLDIQTIIVGEIPLAAGTIHTAHGVTPLPAPATARILRGWPSKSGYPNHEQVTPTGAAIIEALGAPGVYPTWTLEAEGYGAGTRNPPAYPNLVRICIGESTVKDIHPSMYEQDAVIEIQSNIDDMPAEQLAPLIDHLLNAGAVDAHLQSIIMKKGRPGFLCTALCPQHALDSVLDALFTHSTTFGCRYTTKTRAMLQRAWDSVQTAWGEVDVKVGLIGNTLIQSSVEFSHAQRISVETGIPLQHIYHEALVQHRQQFPERYHAGGSQ